MKDFKELCILTHEKAKTEVYRSTLICFDPGETTGYARFENMSLEDTGQLDSKSIPAIVKLIYKELKYHSRPQTSTGSAREVRVIIEDYRIYGWKTESHAWQGLHTPKLIGAMIAICSLLNIPYTLPMAQQAKQFCTDKKLKDWGLYQTGKQHTRDAIRHGCYYLLFNRS